ncbi:MAG: hypothetical protein LBQ12_14050 [Deltaproteobacteria bacterium]|nr:hypothetical protein [Deltaproteobacteria bacterium]
MCRAEHVPGGAASMAVAGEAVAKRHLRPQPPEAECRREVREGRRPRPLRG